MKRRDFLKTSITAADAAAEWQKLRSQPGYGDADIVSNISNVLLKPAAYSQI